LAHSSRHGVLVAEKEQVCCWLKGLDQTMAFPVNLSSSPFHEVFGELFERRSVAEAVQRRLGLVQPNADDNADDANDFDFLRTADEHVIDWTLSRHDEALRYVRLLLGSVSHIVASFEKQESNNRRMTTSIPAVGLETTPLSLEEARSWWTTASAGNDRDGATTAESSTRARTRTRTTAEQRLDVVLLHYAASRLCEIVRALQELSANRKRPTTMTTNGGGTDGRQRMNGTNPAAATMATTFYPDGILLPDWKPLMSLLNCPAVDSFVQRTLRGVPRRDAFCVSVRFGLTIPCRCSVIARCNDRGRRPGLGKRDP
jgi:hypothetical protein